MRGGPEAREGAGQGPARAAQPASACSAGPRPRKSSPGLIRIQHLRINPCPFRFSEKPFQVPLVLLSYANESKVTVFPGVQLLYRIMLPVRSKKIFCPSGHCLNTGNYRLYLNKPEKKKQQELQGKSSFSGRKFF